MPPWGSLACWGTQGGSGCPCGCQAPCPSLTRRGFSKRPQPRAGTCCVGPGPQRGTWPVAHCLSHVGLTACAHQPLTVREEESVSLLSRPSPRRAAPPAGSEVQFPSSCLKTKGGHGADGPPGAPGSGLGVAPVHVWRTCSTEGRPGGDAIADATDVRTGLHGASLATEGG